MKKNGQTASYIPAFTGLRAMAAYLVFLHHYNPAPVGTFANRLFQQGYIGVSVFFVLSGFLIYHRYADNYLEQINWSWRRYLQKRFTRIFPLYVLLLLVTIAIRAQLGHSIRFPLVVLNLTLLQGLFESYKFSGIAQSWSLTVEVCFYLIAPFLFVGLTRWGALCVTIGLVGIGLLLWATIGQLAWHGLFGNLSFVLFYTFFGRSFEFVTGMWLAQWWQQNKVPPSPQTTYNGLFIIAGCLIWQADLGSHTTSQNGLFWSEVVVYNGLLPVGIGLLFVGLLTRPSLLRQFLSLPTIQRFGESAYAFYLIHIGVVAAGLQKLDITNYGLLFCMLAGIAYGLYNYIEKPLARWLRN
ncbi:acyltransferase family protein [Spirosoma radiotolerans]|uniref:Acyltransferase 3 domain-containing protein n=1 Tax=Spirosoma radiotolerans TaxID=1379870 RepID=A0A0E3V839_9BACT|nr:acyltransferase [Spirosoma radiotolerans]AKD55976.1 hypothetical protein SD10_14765 [Spirosoma radiotolerans]